MRSEVLLSLVTAVRDRVRVRVDYERADGEGACVMRAGADELTWVALQLDRLGAPVEVIDPPALLEEIERIGRWAASAAPQVRG